MPNPSFDRFSLAEAEGDDTRDTVPEKNLPRQILPTDISEGMTARSATPRGFSGFGDQPRGRPRRKSKGAPRPWLSLRLVALFCGVRYRRGHQYSYCSLAVFSNTFAPALMMPISLRYRGRALGRARSAPQNRGRTGASELAFEVASDEQKSCEIVFPGVRGLEPSFPGAAGEHRDVGSPLVRQQALVVESVGGQS